MNPMTLDEVLQKAEAGPMTREKAEVLTMRYVAEDGINARPSVLASAFLLKSLRDAEARAEAAEKRWTEANETIRKHLGQHMRIGTAIVADGIPAVAQKIAALEAQVRAATERAEAAEKRVTTVRADAIEEAAKAVEAHRGGWTVHVIENRMVESGSGPWGLPSDFAKAVRALAPKPPAETDEEWDGYPTDEEAEADLIAYAYKPPADPRAPEATTSLVVGSGGDLAPRTKPLGVLIDEAVAASIAKHSFDARRFAEALVEGLTDSRANVALRDHGQAVHIVCEAVRRALDAGSKP